MASIGLKAVAAGTASTNPTYNFDSANTSTYAKDFNWV